MIALADKKIRAAILSVASNSLLIVLKLVVGLLIGSVAVISEAIHSGMDLLAALIAHCRAGFGPRSRQAPSLWPRQVRESLRLHRGHPHLRSRGLDHLQAVCKLLDPQEIDMPFWGVGVMLVSALVNIFVSRRLFKVSEETDSVALADAWHLRTDVHLGLG